MNHDLPVILSPPKLSDPHRTLGIKAFQSLSKLNFYLHPENHPASPFRPVPRASVLECDSPLPLWIKSSDAQGITKPPAKLQPSRSSSLLTIGTNRQLSAAIGTLFLTTPFS